MNIFFVDADPAIAAKSLCDRHVIKMTLETAQIMSAAVRYYAEPIEHHNLYKSTHIHHPCVIWARQTRGNFNWLSVHGVALYQQYRARYGKQHKSSGVILRAAAYADVIPDGEETPFPICMKQHPECIVENDPIQSYRNYYNQVKSKFATWKDSNPPEWYHNGK